MVPLTTLTGWESVPTFSPDGKQVAFLWNGEKRDNTDIYVKAIGGATELRLTTDPARDTLPAWSPDGRQIAFFSVRDAGGIYLVSPLGGPQRRVARFQVSSRPAWSPDGKYLVVAQSYREANPQTNDGALFAIPVEGGDAPRRLLVPPSGTWYGNPAIAPDGRSLAFSCLHGFGECAEVRPPDGRIEEGLVLAGSVREVTKPSWYWIYGLTWVPDGGSLIFARRSFGWVVRLWRVHARNGKEPERLEIAGEGAHWPAIDAKGTRLAFARRLRMQTFGGWRPAGQRHPF